MFAYSVDNTLVLISQAMTQIEVMETGLKVRVCFALASAKWYVLIGSRKYSSLVASVRVRISSRESANLETREELSSTEEMTGELS